MALDSRVFIQLAPLRSASGKAVEEFTSLD